MAVGLMNAPDEKTRARLDERVQPRYPPVSSTTIQRMGHPLHERYVREPAPALRRRSVHAARCVFRLREHGGSLLRAPQDRFALAVDLQEEVEKIVGGGINHRVRPNGTDHKVSYVAYWGSRDSHNNVLVELKLRASSEILFGSQLSWQIL